MPRDGSGVYSKPSASFVPNTTITSAAVNADFDDLVNDANYARPITAGGTGATNAATALLNLGALALAGGTMSGDLSVGGNKLSLAKSFNEGPINGFRNKLINGNFDIWQRGLSFNGPGYVADRWSLGGGGAGYAYTATQVALPPGTVYGSSYAFEINQTGGASTTYISQPIEDVQTLAGKKVTVTFYARNVSNNPNVGVRLDQVFGSGGSATAVGGPTTVPISAAWAKYSVVINLPSITGQTVGAGSNLLLYLFNTTLGRVQFARISVVEGDATAEDDPFSPRHIQQELALCQRYFVSMGGSANFEVFATGEVGNATNAYCYAKMPVRMRATPTVSTSGSLALLAGSTVAISVSAVSINAGSPDGLLLQCTAAGMTAGWAAHLTPNGNTTARITFSAEL